MNAAPRRHAAGIALALLTPLLFAASDTAVRYLNGTVPLIAILAVRYATHLLVMGPCLAFSRRHGFASANPVFQLARGLLLLGCSGLFLIALQHMPVAECTAVLMLTPGPRDVDGRHAAQEAGDAAALGTRDRRIRRRAGDRQAGQRRVRLERLAAVRRSIVLCDVPDPHQPLCGARQRLHHALLDGGGGHGRAAADRRADPGTRFGRRPARRAGHPAAIVDGGAARHRRGQHRRSPVADPGVRAPARFGGGAADVFPDCRCPDPQRLVPRPVARCHGMDRHRHRGGPAGPPLRG